MTAPTPTPDAPAPLNAGEREKLARLAEAATPGPWRQDHALTGVYSIASSHPSGGIYGHVAEGAEEDAAYIAAASPDHILALLAERDALAERVERVKVDHGHADTCGSEFAALYRDQAEHDAWVRTRLAHPIPHATTTPEESK